MSHVPAHPTRADWEIDLGPPPYPNDAERQMAIDFVREHGTGGGSNVYAPAFMSALSRRFAAYRVELLGEEV